MSCSENPALGTQGFDLSNVPSRGQTPGVLADFCEHAGLWSDRHQYYAVCETSRRAGRQLAPRRGGRRLQRAQQIGPVELRQVLRGETVQASAE